MKRTVHNPRRDDSERENLRRRVKQFYQRFNSENWEGCFSMIDPRLIQGKKVELGTYVERMRAFKSVYGSVNFWRTVLSLHLNGAPNQGDVRPFGYVYVIWQDDARGFHMFRERWIKDRGRWFTRVVGLVPNKQETGSGRA